MITSQCVIQAPSSALAQKKQDERETNGTTTTTTMVFIRYVLATES